MKLVFVVPLSDTFNDVLNEVGADNRLVSFAYVGDKAKFVDHFASTRVCNRTAHKALEQQRKEMEQKQ